MIVAILGIGGLCYCSKRKNKKYNDRIVVNQIEEDEVGDEEQGTYYTSKTSEITN